MEKTVSSLESTQEFFDLWLNTYESTFGRMLKAPTVGPAREKTEQALKGIPDYVHYYASYTDAAINFQNVFMEAMRKTQESIIEQQPETYRDYYSIWLETYSDTLKDFLKSGHFAKDLGKFVSSLMDVQQYNKEMLETNYLKPMNIPTKTEFDELNKEIYLLKKQVKELGKQVKSLAARKGESGSAR